MYVILQDFLIRLSEETTKNIAQLVLEMIVMT